MRRMICTKKQTCKVKLHLNMTDFKSLFGTVLQCVISGMFAVSVLASVSVISKNVSKTECCQDDLTRSSVRPLTVRASSSKGGDSIPSAPPFLPLPRAHSIPRRRGQANKCSEHHCSVLPRSEALALGHGVASTQGDSRRLFILHFVLLAFCRQSLGSGDGWVCSNLESGGLEFRFRVRHLPVSLDRSHDRAHQWGYLLQSWALNFYLKKF